MQAELWRSSAPDSSAADSYFSVVPRGMGFPVTSSAADSAASAISRDSSAIGLAHV